MGHTCTAWVMLVLRGTRVVHGTHLYCIGHTFCMGHTCTAWGTSLFMHFDLKKTLRVRDSCCSKERRDGMRSLQTQRTASCERPDRPPLSTHCCFPTPHFSKAHAHQQLLLCYRRHPFCCSCPLLSCLHAFLKCGHPLQLQRESTALFAHKCHTVCLYADVH